VKEADGKVNNWEFELGSPNGLLRQGWKKDSIKRVTYITCRGSLARTVRTSPNASKTDFGRRPQGSAQRFLRRHHCPSSNNFISRKNRHGESKWNLRRGCTPS